MKKLEQAIAYFEDAIRESDEIIAECSEKLQKELIEQKGHFEVALEVMKKQSKPCRWHLYNEDQNVWEADCGNLFTLIEGSPKDNEMQFCPYCSREIDEMEVYEP